MERIPDLSILLTEGWHVLFVEKFDEATCLPQLKSPIQDERKKRATHYACLSGKRPGLLLVLKDEAEVEQARRSAVHAQQVVSLSVKFHCRARNMFENVDIPAFTENINNLTGGMIELEGNDGFVVTFRELSTEEILESLRNKLEDVLVVLSIKNRAGFWIKAQRITERTIAYPGLFVSDFERLCGCGAGTVDGTDGCQ